MTDSQRPGPLTVEYRTADGQRRRDRFVPTDSDDARREEWVKGADGWRLVGSEDVRGVDVRP